MPQLRVIRETDGVLVGLEGPEDRSCAAWLRNKGPVGRRHSEATPALLHHLQDRAVFIAHAPATAYESLSRLAAATGTSTVFATSRQALCRSIRALEMAAFKGEPFRETNKGYLKQRL